MSISFEKVWSARCNGNTHKAMLIQWQQKNKTDSNFSKQLQDVEHAVVTLLVNIGFLDMGPASTSFESAVMPAVKAKLATLFQDYPSAVFVWKELLPVRTLRKDFRTALADLWAYCRQLYMDQMKILFLSCGSDETVTYGVFQDRKCVATSNVDASGSFNTGRDLDETSVFPVPVFNDFDPKCFELDESRAGASYPAVAMSPTLQAFQTVHNFGTDAFDAFDDTPKRRKSKRP